MLRMLYRGSITRVSIVSSHTRGLAIARPSSTPPLARLACPRDSKTATLTNSGLFPSPITHLRALNSSCLASQTNDLKMKQPVPNTPADVIAQLPASFAKAKESGDLLFFPSTVHKHSECGVEVFSVFSCFIFCVLADGSPLVTSGRSRYALHCRTSRSCPRRTSTLRRTRGDRCLRRTERSLTRSHRLMCQICTSASSRAKRKARSM
jgi:hypothetical protein